MTARRTPFLSLAVRCPCGRSHSLFEPAEVDREALRRDRARAACGRPRTRSRRAVDEREAVRAAWSKVPPLNDAVLVAGGAVLSEHPEVGVLVAVAALRHASVLTLRGALDVALDTRQRRVSFPASVKLCSRVVHRAGLPGGRGMARGAGGLRIFPACASGGQALHSAYFRPSVRRVVVALRARDGPCERPPTVTGGARVVERLRRSLANGCVVDVAARRRQRPARRCVLSLWHEPQARVGRLGRSESCGTCRSRLAIARMAAVEREAGLLEVVEAPSVERPDVGVARPRARRGRPRTRR